ncbi:MAG: UDP-N-acetylmuramoyl-L-alanyl-D-glutamate--2,6-diaminopimelate ligase [Candidatus Accumulibacter sp.]|jgi:UDP-N-acetylmuramoyl-L-alanyl-D-glutamate--2,6-diaminopimelate ligase|nr:UDP-N-acetylmuramoyl-L-alanyl-D-glutamate--2,6-diaminopimelate ligase [Accumulibacter sp.]
MSAAPIFAEASTILRDLAAQGAQAQGVADDSRRVRPGDLFMAFPGDLADGREHIPEAIARGAAAVVWQRGGDFAWRDEWRLPNLGATRLRPLCGPLSHAVSGHPSERLSLIAITGTNGKTSVGQWLARLHPRRCALIGTLGAGFPGELAETGFTTPEAAALARCLADFAADGAQACALEASSIGIEEQRLDGARVDVAVFTNLTRDHLDYHRSMEDYAAAKERLFRWPRLRLAVINADDDYGRELMLRTSASRVLGYTRQAAFADRPGIVRADAVEETPGGLRFVLAAPTGRARVETRLFGRFNVANLLAVAAVLIDAGLTPAEVAEGFADLPPPPGRLEAIGGQGEPLLVVDYAHTPDALENVLDTLRGTAAARGGRLVAVFGCGGDRDRGKRPLMGEIARRLANRVVLTSDNPRGEDPAAILAEIQAGMQAGMRAAAPDAEVIADRAAAIRQTVAAAAAADVVLLAGKGHEACQEIAGARRPFSDVDEARGALAAWREKQQ